MDIEQFYRENYRILFGYLFSLCRDRHQAEDLTSETFLRAIQKIHSFDGSVKASTWLCTIGRNLYLNECKKSGRAAPLEEYLCVGQASPEDVMLQKERIHLLLQQIEGLEESKKHLLLLRQQGLSFREIGEVLGKTETWARVSFFRLKDAILKRMEETK